MKARLHGELLICVGCGEGFVCYGDSSEKPFRCIKCSIPFIKQRHGLWLKSKDFPNNLSRQNNHSVRTS